MAAALYLYIVRTLLVVLTMMFSAIYIEAFCCAEADAREKFLSVAEDLAEIFHDTLHRRDLEVKSLSLPIGRPSRVVLS